MCALQASIFRSSSGYALPCSLLHFKREDFGRFLTFSNNVLFPPYHATNEKPVAHALGFKVPKAGVALQHSMVSKMREYYLRSNTKAPDQHGYI